MSVRCRLLESLEAAAGGDGGDGITACQFSFFLISSLSLAISFLSVEEFH